MNNKEMMLILNRLDIEEIEEIERVIKQIEELIIIVKKLKEIEKKVENEIEGLVNNKESE